MFTCEDYSDHEKVVMISDPCGLKAFIAIHNTKLGPAAGGCRWYQYSEPYDALKDALRLSKGMTYKNALAGLPLGGGKAVIMAPKNVTMTSERKKEYLTAFAKQVEALNGEYNTAIDVGINVDDVRHMAQTTQYAFGLNNFVASSTAMGGFAALRAAMEHVYGDVNFNDKKFVIQGVGQTGMALVRMITEQGGKCFVADPNYNALLAAEKDYGATKIGIEDVMKWDCDVFLPCALGGILTSDAVAKLNCDIVCGLANNQLAHENISKELLAKGITYVPDYVANAGGIMHASNDIKCMEHSTFDRSQDAIEEHIMKTTSYILDVSRREHLGTNFMANKLAEDMLSQ